jgi:predicted amidohydrolase
VVLGSAHPLTPPHRPHNSLYVISDKGQLVDRYDKRFCSNTEITRFLSLSVPAQTARLMASGLIGPDGSCLAPADAGAELVVADMDRHAPDLHVALNLARPWRATARQGDIYRTRRVADSRSADRTCM